MRSVDDLLAEFDVDELAVEEVLPPSYNVAPTDPVPVVLERPARPPDPGRGAAGRPEPVRRLTTARWGLIPSWADNVRVGARMINARVETVAEKPAFRVAAAKRRCVVPADGYYEWYADAGRKQPYFIRPGDEAVLAFAGLYEIWRDHSRAEDDPAAWLWSCTIITTEATDDLGHVHDRMPMVVPASRRSAWLDTSRTDPGDARRLLVPAGQLGLVTYPVSRDVGDVRVNAPYLVDPLPPGTADDDVPTLF